MSHALSLTPVAVGLQEWPGSRSLLFTEVRVQRAQILILAFVLIVGIDFPTFLAGSPLLPLPVFPLISACSSFFLGMIQQIVSASLGIEP